MNNLPADKPSALQVTNDKDRIAVARATHDALMAARVDAVEHMSPTQRSEYDAAVIVGAEALARVREAKANGMQRHVSDVWAVVMPDRLADIKIAGKDISKIEWQRSHAGVATALFVLEILFIMTKAELAAVAVPTGNWGNRKVDVARGDSMHTAVRIRSLLSGNSMLLTDADKYVVNANMIVKLKMARPKGITTTNDTETAATKAMHALIGLDERLEVVFCTEFRLADCAMRKLGSADLAAYAADQTKSTNVQSNGRLNFNTNVGEALKIIGGGDFKSKEPSRGVVARWERMSLTLIGMENGIVKVVWYLQGQEALDMLARFPAGQRFEPMLYPKIASSHPFTKEINKPYWRFDVGDVSVAMAEAECTRLLQAKCNYATGDFAALKLLNFWSRDLSQIPLDNHKKEQQAFDRIQELLAPFGAIVSRDPADNYGATDWHVITANNDARIQNKRVSPGKTASNDIFGMHGNTGKRYDLLVDFDSLDVYDLRTDVVYSLPARMLSAADGQPVPYLSAEELSKCTVNISVAWKARHAPYCCNLRTDKGVMKYLQLQDERAL
jgi:hypothetical protein